MNFDVDEARQISSDSFWYIATPYAKYPDGIDAAFQDACKASAWLIKQGVRIYCPIAHTHPIALYGNIDPYSHDIWLPVDRPFMQAACGVIVVRLPTWEISYGIQCEIEEMNKQNKPVRYLWVEDMRE
jgi:hypothetical protein